MDNERQQSFLLQPADLNGETSAFVDSSYGRLIVDNSAASITQDQLPVIYTPSSQEEQVYVAIKSSTSGDTTIAAIPLSVIAGHQGSLTIDPCHGSILAASHQLSDLTTHADDQDNVQINSDSLDKVNSHQSSDVSASIGAVTEYSRQVTRIEELQASVEADKNLEEYTLQALQTGQDHLQLSKDTQQTASHSGNKIFENIKATLSKSLLDSIPGSRDVVLHHLQTGVGVQVEHDILNERYIVTSDTWTDLQRIEQHMAHLLPQFGLQPKTNFTNQVTQTCNKLNCSQDMKEDKAVFCDLLKPQYSRSGRELKAKDPGYYVFPKSSLLDEPDAPSSPKEKRPTVTKRKRGRPRKNVNKLAVEEIHDDLDSQSDKPEVRKENAKRIAELPVASWETDLVDSVMNHDRRREILLNEGADDHVISSDHETLVLAGNSAGVVEEDQISLLEAQRILEVAGREVLDNQIGSLQELVSEKENKEKSDEDPDQEEEEEEEDMAADSDCDPLYNPNNEESMEPSSSIQNNAGKKARKNYEAMAPFKFFCTMCSFKTKRASHYLKHKKLHEKNMPLLHCKKCNFRSIRLSHLRRHELTHSSEVFKCTKCRYVTNSNKLLMKHIKLKHGLKKTSSRPVMKMNQCPRCDYKTTRLQYFLRHIRCHTDLTSDTKEADNIEKMLTSFKCDQCTYKTQRKEHYLRHMNNVHSDHRPYLCDLCGKAFKRPDALRQHKVTHMDKTSREYPFQCNLCNKGFRSKAHLTEHKTRHTNVRSYLCEICGSSFKTRSVQRKHVQTIHKNPRAYPCNQCTKRFNTKYALRRHNRTHETPGMRAIQEQNIQQIEIQPTEVQVIEAHPLVAELSTNPVDAEVQIVHDIEDFKQDDSTIAHAGATYIQTNETTTALLYLRDCNQNTGFFI